MTSQKIIPCGINNSRNHSTTKELKTASRLDATLQSFEEIARKKQGVLSQGAEAKIFLEERSSAHSKSASEANVIGRGGRENAELPQKFIIKSRIPKSYRIKELDDKIRKSRTKAETKLLLKASKIINSPAPEETKESYQIIMPFIEGKKLSENLDKLKIDLQIKVCEQIGNSISKLHQEGLIHGDLTTSNMIYVEESCELTKYRASEVSETSGGRAGTSKIPNFKIYFIDFGLGYQNGKYEDKAVDLHVLKQALEAKHFKNWENLWKAVESGYLSFNKTESQKTLERLKAVEKRGRYKH